MGTLRKYRTNLLGVAELNRNNIHGGYQNHSVNGGGPVWDLHELLRDVPPDFLGSQYVRHAMVEGPTHGLLACV